MRRPPGRSRRALRRLGLEAGVALQPARGSGSTSSLAARQGSPRRFLGGHVRFHHSFSSSDRISQRRIQQASEFLMPRAGRYFPHRPRICRFTAESATKAGYPTGCKGRALARAARALEAPLVPLPSLRPADRPAIGWPYSANALASGPVEPPGVRSRDAAPVEADGDVFEARWSLTRGGPLWTFYAGPPTANGMPASTTSRHVFKDNVPPVQDHAGLPVSA